MRRAGLCAAAIVLIVGAHLGMRAAGMGAHLGAIVGMPPSGSSLVIAGLYAGSYLAACVVAPVVALAGIFEIAVALRRG